MKAAIIIVRGLMAVLFLVSVCNYLIPFMPEPELTEDASAFIGGLVISGYLLPLVKAVELLSSLAFITGRFVALAIVLIFPISLNILLFHAFLDPGNMIVPLFIFLGNIFLAFAYRERYKPVLAVR